MRKERREYYGLPFNSLKSIQANRHIQLHILYFIIVEIKQSLVFTVNTAFLIYGFLQLHESGKQILSYKVKKKNDYILRAKRITHWALLDYLQNRFKNGMINCF